MKIPLSIRLKACADLVKPGEQIADIGCDHGYLGIYLLSNHIASSVIAADINKMPLESARQNAEKYGLSGKIDFYLSDGAQSIPRDFDTMICAGMGADTIISILEQAPWLQNTQYTLILQCQSKTPMLRTYLSDNGWYVPEEHVLQDGRFLYTVMRVIWVPDVHRITPAQSYFPASVLKGDLSDIKRYFDWVIGGIKIQIQHRHDPQLEMLLKDLELAGSICFDEWEEK